jgi:hypothetical protein
MDGRTNNRMDLEVRGVNIRNVINSAEDRDYWRVLVMRH